MNTLPLNNKVVNVFVLPKCVVGLYGFTISNWTLEDFKIFFDVTENSEFSLVKPGKQEGQEPCSCQERMTVAVPSTVSDRRAKPFTPLSLRTLSMLAKTVHPFIDEHGCRVLIIATGCRSLSARNCCFVP